jgi:hypothetical protein
LANEEKLSKILRVRIDPDLLENVKRESDKLEVDVSTYVRWCIQTGLYLEDLNTFIRSRTNESSPDDLPNSWHNRGR